MNERETRCPKCDYSLKGLIDSWEQSCPLRITCSECGLDFDCGRVLSMQLLGPAWCYEFSALPSFARWRSTSLISLNPRRLCRELEVDHRIAAGRLIRFASRWLLIAHFTAAAIVVGMQELIGHVTAVPGFRWFEDAFSLFGRPVSWLAPVLLLPSVFEVACKDAIGSWAPIPLLPICLAIFLPGLFMGVWTLLLDDTFRIARVRRAHLLRGVAYSLPGAAGGMVLVLAAQIATAAATMDREQATLAAWLLIAAFQAYHLLWWHRFVKRYLRLNHAAAVVGVHYFMTCLVLAAAFAVLSAKGMWR